MKKFIIFALIAIVIMIPIASSNRNEKPINNEIEVNGTDNVLLISEQKIPESGSPDDYTPYENLQFAAYKFNHTPTWQTYYSGEVTALGTKQQVRNRRIYDNGILFFEAISVSALKQVAEQKYYSGDTILIRPPVKIDRKSISATWDRNMTTLSEEDYYDDYGLKPNELFKYIMDSSTIISAERLEGYIYKFVLSNECAKYLKREVRTMAGSKSDAEYLEVECSMEIDKDWNIIRTTAKERYKIAIFGNITCTLASTEEFTLNCDVSIPDRELFQKFITDISGNDNGSESKNN